MRDVITVCSNATIGGGCNGLRINWKFKTNIPGAREDLRGSGCKAMVFSSIWSGTLGGGLDMHRPYLTCWFQTQRGIPSSCGSTISLAGALAWWSDKSFVWLVIADLITIRRFNEIDIKKLREITLALPSETNEPNMENLRQLMQWS